MPFGFSIGDIILCARIAHRLFSSVTAGRNKAPRDLKELQDALFGLCYALDLLQVKHKAIMASATSRPNIVTPPTNQPLGYMIKSCQKTLEELDNATAKYRAAADDPPLVRAQVRAQWKRILWDLRGDSLTKYRQKLQSHTDSISLVLSTFIWSTTDRIEEQNKRHAQKLNELYYQTSQFNKNVYQLEQTPGHHNYAQSHHIYEPLAQGARLTKQ